MIKIDGNSLNIAALHSLAFESPRLEVDAEAMQKVARSHEFLNGFSKQKLIYGVNTGFGPMAQYRIDDRDLIGLQYNIIRSHASGLGDYLDKNSSKAVLVNLMNAMLRSHSGVHPDLIRTIESMYLADVIPCIPVHGGVGASGDLVQMAHVALSIIGEGEAYCEGKITDAAEAFGMKKINPFKIRKREGIAMMNGTTAMTAVAALNVHYAQIALEWSLALSACLNEAMKSYDDHYSANLNSVKKHSGQQLIANAMSNFLQDSGRILSREKLYATEVTDKYIEHKVQPYYSLRCIPQILGPVYDSLLFAKRTVENELNSTGDNPVIFEENVYHGGNFHGDYISLEMDKLKLVMTRVGMLSERQLNYLMNPAINACLKPFVNSGVPGLNFGFQGIQFTATSTAAENQTLSSSHYIHSIPNNNDNQDIVSMGFNASCAAAKVVENVFEILAIQSACMLQCIDMLDCLEELSSKSRKMYSDLRTIFAPICQDRSTRADLIVLKEYLKQNPAKIMIND